MLLLLLALILTSQVLSVASDIIAHSVGSVAVVSGLTLVGGWRRSAHLARLFSVFSAPSGHTQFARAGFGMQCICASFSGISCLISCSRHICPSLSSNLKSMSVIKYKVVESVR